MPFPWKKKKSRVTRISRIVADLQSPKRGGSLVVQTGFPTSLIDLFVKNQSRFARPKSKKPVRPEEIPDPPPPPPSPATTPPPSFPTLPPRPEAPTPDPLIRENTNADNNLGRVGECESGSGIKLFGVVLRILVVVVLIVSVKRLTVGITISAFALLFLEYAAKRAVSCSRTFAWFEKLPLQLKLKEEDEEESEVAIFQDELAELRSRSSVFDEIEVVETNSEQISSSLVGPELGLVPELLEEEVNDDDDDDSSKVKVVLEVSESKSSSRGSRGNFKSKMVKRLVPKKLRGYKKERKMEKVGKEGEAESGSEVSSAVEEDKRTSFEIEEETATNVGKNELLECIRDDDDDCGIISNEGKKIRKIGNSSYTILLVTALSGLVVGRFPALMLTMTWCFMLKIVKTLWRTQDVPWL